MSGCRSAVTALLCLCSVLAARAEAREAGCVVFDALEPVIAAGTAEAPKAQAPANTQAPVRRERRPTGPPVSEKELQLLMKGLEVVPVAEGKGHVRRLVMDPAGFTPQRFAVVAGDVSALLADIHVDESLKAVRGAKGLDPSTRSWMEKGLAGIHGCAQGRFAGRGGDPAYRAARGLVERNRQGLEGLLFDARFGGGAPPMP